MILDALVQPIVAPRVLLRSLSLLLRLLGHGLLSPLSKRSCKPIYDKNLCEPYYCTLVGKIDLHGTKNDRSWGKILPVSKDIKVRAYMHGFVKNKDMEDL